MLGVNMFTGKCSCKKCAGIRSNVNGRRVKYTPCVNCDRQTPMSLKGGNEEVLCSTCDIKDKQANKHE